MPDARRLVAPSASTGQENTGDARPGRQARHLMPDSTAGERSSYLPDIDAIQQPERPGINQDPAAFLGPAPVQGGQGPGPSYALPREGRGRQPSDWLRAPPPGRAEEATTLIARSH